MARRMRRPACRPMGRLAQSLLSTTVMLDQIARRLAIRILEHRIGAGLDEQLCARLAARSGGEVQRRLLVDARRLWPPPPSPPLLTPELETLLLAISTLLVAGLLTGYFAFKRRMPVPVSWVDLNSEARWELMYSF